MHDTISLSSSQIPQAFMYTQQNHLYNQTLTVSYVITKMVYQLNRTL
jgi:hypothetical protein